MTLCVITGCLDPGSHLDDCTNAQCRGCRPRYAESGIVCNSDRTRIAAELDDIPQLHAEMEADADPADRTPWTVVQHNVPVPTTNPAQVPAWIPGPGRTEPGRDDVARLLPMGMTRSGRNGGKVSGSRQAPIPVNVDRVDLLLPARPQTRRLYARGVLGIDTDQTGHLSLSTELQSCVEEWIAWRGKGERAPQPTVPELARWLADRLDDAMDAFPGIDDFARDIAEYRATMRHILELNKAPREMLIAVECKACDLAALYREDGHIWCGNCRLYYSENDYTKWTKLLAGQSERVAA